MPFWAPLMPRNTATAVGEGVWGLREASRLDSCHSLSCLGSTASGCCCEASLHQALLRL